MARTIQDSDDDFEEDDLDAPFEGPVDASTKRDACSPQRESGEHGTGSTESLKKAFEAAHRAHFRSQVDPSVQSAPQDALNDDFVSQRGNKRRKISHDASLESRGPDFNFAAELQRHGKPKTELSSPFLEPERAGLGPDVQGGDTVFYQQMAGESRVQYEPMSMFSEPSSTIPNATLTQQRLLEEVMNPAFLGLEPDGDMPTFRYEPQVSIPWSDFLNTSSENTQTHAKATNAADQAAPKNAPSEEPQPVTSQSQGCSQRRRSSMPLKGSPLRNEIDVKDLPHTTRDVHELDTGGQRQLHSESHNKNQPREKPSPSPSTKRKLKPSPVTISDDPLESIGLPEEQYRPRPSRSRSARASLVQPVDYSVVPEKAATKRARRSKTSTAAVSATPRKVQQVCDMGFTPNTTQRALEKNNGDVTQTVDWLVSNVNIDDRDELAPPTPIKTKDKSSIASISRAPKEQVEQSCADDQLGEVVLSKPIHNLDAEDSNQNVKTPSNTKDPSKEMKSLVQVVVSKVHEPVPEERNSPTLIPTTETPNMKPKRRKTTLDQPEPDSEEIVLDLAKPKKRGRGRPRKEPVTVSSTTVEEAQRENTAAGTGKQSATSGANSEDQTAATSLPIIEPTVSAPPAKTLDGLAEAKHTNTTDGASAARSTGRVPYRVGLSKRTRITPLLKIMRK